MRDDARTSTIAQRVRDIAVRPDVAIHADDGDSITIVDGLTRWQLVIEDVESVDELIAFLRDAAMTDEHRDPDQARAKQRRLRQRLQADERRDAVADLLAFVVEHVPYYRERADVYRRSGERDLLADLPLLFKPDLRNHFRQFIADGVDVPGGLDRGELELAASSGTTDERVQVIADMELDALPDDYETLWPVSGLRDIPRTAVFTSPECMGVHCHLGRMTFDQRKRGEHTVFLDSTRDLFSLRRPLVEHIADELARFDADFLFVNPIYLHWLGRVARQHGIDLPRPRLIMTSYQYLSVLQRRALIDLFDVPIVGFYSATEFAGARQAIQCSEGALHVREDHSVIEILSDGRPAPRGALGALAVTAHCNRVFPLVRFAVGDVGALVDRDCPCPLGHWDAIELHGRSKDMIAVGDRWVTTRQIDDALGDTPGLAFYQLVQHSADHATIDVIAQLGESVRAADVSERLRDRIGLTARVRDARRLEPAPSLKFVQTRCRFRAPPASP